MEIGWKSSRILMEINDNQRLDVIFHNIISMKIPTFNKYTNNFMEEFKKIVALSFIRAHKKNPLATSKNALAKIISEEMNKNEGGEIIDEHRYSKTLLNYYNFYFNEGKKQTPSDSIINKLLKYLGYDSQKQFTTNQLSDTSYLDRVPFVNYEKDTIIIDNSNKKEVVGINNEGRNSDGNDILKNTILILSIISTIATILYFVSIWLSKDEQLEKTNCMIWNQDHYEKVVCGKTDETEIAVNVGLIENFKKIELDTTMVFFKEGKALFWYDKTGGKIEFFTKGGKHPTNGKVLRPATQKIIRKYVFGEE